MDPAIPLGTSRTPQGTPAMHFPLVAAGSQSALYVQILLKCVYRLTHAMHARSARMQCTHTVHARSARRLYARTHMHAHMHVHMQACTHVCARAHMHTRPLSSRLWRIFASATIGIIQTMMSGVCALFLHVCPCEFVGVCAYMRCVIPCVYWVYR